MFTIQDIIKATEKYHRSGSIIKNARDVSIRVYSVEEYLDEHDDLFKEVKIVARDKSVPRKVFLRMWAKRGGRYSKHSYCFCTCTCEFFKYYCDQALWKKGNGSSFKWEGLEEPDTSRPYVADPAKRNKNEKFQVNPALVPYACKHIIRAFQMEVWTRKRKTRNLEPESKAIWGD